MVGSLPPTAAGDCNEDLAHSAENSADASTTIACSPANNVNSSAVAGEEERACADTDAVECFERDSVEHAVEGSTVHSGRNVRVTCIACFSALGAFLFGLDIGYIAPILESRSFKRDVAHLENWEDVESTISSATSGFIVGIFSIGCMLSSFPVVSSYFLDTWGRRASIMLGSAVFLVAVALQATSSSVGQMLIGRFVAGCSIGLLSTVVTLYQGEIAPRHMRGSLTSLYQLMVAFGILVAAAVDAALVHTDDGWREAVWLQAFPSTFLFFGMLCLPRSPRWLVAQDRTEEALQVLQSLCAEADAQQELEDIIANHEAAKALGKPRWPEVFSGRMGKLVLVGTTMQLLQQLVGMNAFMYFGPRIFHSLGLSMNTFQTINNAINFVATFPAIYLADRCGRRRLLISGSIGMIVSCGVMGTLGLVSMSRDGDNWTPVNGTVGKAVAAMVFLFVVNFAYSWGPMVWVYCAEIFPLKYRSRGVGLTTASNWVGNFLIAQFTPVLLATLGFGTFFIFGAFSVASLLLALWIPETKGITLEHIDSLFDQKFGMEAERMPRVQTRPVEVELQIKPTRPAVLGMVSAPTQERETDNLVSWKH